MRKFVFVSVVASLIASSSLFAKGPNNPANFETAKARMSELADKRINIIKEFKACVEASTDINALKECRKKEANAMRELKPKKEPRGSRSMRDGNNAQPGAGNKSMM